MPPKKRKPGPVPKEALRYFKSKKIKVSFGKPEWNEDHAVAFTVAKIAEADILADVHASLTRAIETGQSFDTWAKGITGRFDDSGWSNYHGGKQTPSRLKTIYDTNQRVARSVGQWDRIQRTKATQPFLVYQLGSSIRHRPEHVELEGIIRAVDDPFWDFAMPPNGFRCKCYVEQLTRAREKNETSTPMPRVTQEPFKNTRTGKTVSLPTIKVDGVKKPIVQPGFNNNPGKIDRQKQADVNLKQAERDAKTR